MDCATVGTRSNSYDARRLENERDGEQRRLFDGAAPARRDPPPAAPRPTTRAANEAGAWPEVAPPENPVTPAMPDPGDEGDEGLSAIERAWLAFHAKHPTVLPHFIGEALILLDEQIARGVPRDRVRLGAKDVWETLRTKLGPLGINLNNNFTALYARKAIEEQPRLRGCFQLRRRRGEE